ncbi:hypothetical protein D3C77_651260 [compost metagenome]
MPTSVSSATFDWRASSTPSVFIKLMLLSLPMSRRRNSSVKYDRRKAPAAMPANSPLAPSMRRLKLMHQSGLPRRALNGGLIISPRSAC